MAQVSYSKVNKSSKDISVSGLNLSVPGKQLLVDTKLTLSHGHRYVLVAANGSGKSTLLKCLADGSIPVPYQVSRFLVGQELEKIPENLDSVQYVLRSNTVKATLLQQQERLEDRLADAAFDGMDEILRELDEVALELRTCSADEAMIKRILNGLGFTDELQKKPPKELSGGWRMRLSFARAIFNKPDLLLLDEPSNHLDLRALIYVTEQLSSWPTTLLCVTHDIALIEEIATDVTLMMEETKKLRNFTGTYYDTLKTLRSEGINCEKGYHFDFGNSMYECPLGANVQVSDMCYEYKIGHRVLQNLDFNLDPKSRVAVIGLNGSGKSTLLKLLNRDLVPTYGEVKINRKVRIAYFGQHVVDTMPENKSALTYLQARHNLSITEIHKALSKFGLAKAERIRNFPYLSGGQRTRVILTDIYLHQPHILLLDEITNHLDMESVSRLADAIDEFAGGIIMASHDRELLNRVTSYSDQSEIWELIDGHLWRRQGTFSEYCNDIMDMLRE